MAYAVHIYMTDEQVRKLNMMMLARKACEEFYPKGNICDAVCLMVIQDIAMQQKGEKRAVKE